MDQEYEDFLEKFSPKKTTDDCYTPPNIYAAVAAWVEREYNVSFCDFVRPFYPGGDFENQVYLPGGVVVDNPPFSMITRICRFYDERGIKYFLFAPTLTCFQSLSEGNTAIVCGATVTYDNGARVNTSFLTNLDTCRCRTAPELYVAVNAADEANRREKNRQLPKYSYPDNVVTSAKMSVWARYGVDFRVEREESCFVSRLDSQRESKKDIFGRGLLCSDFAAAAAAAAADDRQCWQLSERERELVAELNSHHMA